MRGPGANVLPLLLLQSLEQTGVLDTLSRRGENVAGTLQHAKGLVLLNAVLQETVTFQLAPGIIARDRAPKLRPLLPSSPMSIMSLSPTTSTSNYDETPSTKRRRTTSFTAAANSGPWSEMASPQDSPSGHGVSSSIAAAHIPKRGARACTKGRVLQGRH